MYLLLLKTSKISYFRAFSQLLTFEHCYKKLLLVAARAYPIDPVKKKGIKLTQRLAIIPGSVSERLDRHLPCL